MSHCYHPELTGYDPEAILHDGCPRCEERSSKGLSGLLELDSGNLDLLWRRCLTTEYGGEKKDPEAGRYRSNCEARLGHQLYLVGVLLQNYEDVWQLDRFAARVRA
jgi:hypothetical protein